MSLPLILIALLGLSAMAYHVGRRRAFSVAQGRTRTLHSLPSHYGYYVALWCALPSLVLTVLWLGLEGTVITALLTPLMPAEIVAQGADRIALAVGEAYNIARGNVPPEFNPGLVAAAQRYAELQSTSYWLLAACVLVLVLVALVYGLSRIQPEMRARNAVERVVKVLLLLSSTVAVLTTIGIVLSVLFEALRFFQLVSAREFLMGTTWSPQAVLRTDQVGVGASAFGAVPLFVGTLLISAIAMAVAIPIGLLTAIYLAEYAGPAVRSWAKPALEILAGVPTVVYGFFAAFTVAPFIRDLGMSLGLDVSAQSALAAGLVMGMMIIPFISSLSDDVINAVPQSLRDGSYAMGATRSETVRRVVFPAALPGIAGSILLALSRAIGETMIVVMAAGMVANLSINPLQSVTTVTVQIAAMMVGDQEFGDARTLSAFALGLMLFVVTLLLNVLALYIVRKYREQYD